MDKECEANSNILEETETIRPKKKRKLQDSDSQIMNKTNKKCKVQLEDHNDSQETTAILNKKSPAKKASKIVNSPSKKSPVKKLNNVDTVEVETSLPKKKSPVKKSNKIVKNGIINDENKLNSTNNTECKTPSPKKKSPVKKKTISDDNEITLNADTSNCDQISLFHGKDSLELKREGLTDVSITIYIYMY